MRTSLLIGVALTAALAAGCGSPDAVVVNGIIQSDGQPYKPTEAQDAITVTFHHQGRSLQSNADVDAANGTFTARGSGKEGLPPGDYKITVRVTPYSSGQDRLKNKYGDPRTTPFAYTATRGSQRVTQDVTAGRLTAQ